MFLCSFASCLLMQCLGHVQHADLCRLRNEVAFATFIASINVITILLSSRSCWLLLADGRLRSLYLTGWYTLIFLTPYPFTRDGSGKRSVDPVVSTRSHIAPHKYCFWQLDAHDGCSMNSRGRSETSDESFFTVSTTCCCIVAVGFLVWRSMCGALSL